MSARLLIALTLMPFWRRWVACSPVACHMPANHNDCQ